MSTAQPGSIAFTRESQQHQYKYFTLIASITILCYEIVPISFNWVMTLYPPTQALVTN